MEFNDKCRPRTKEGNMKKGNIFNSVNAIYESRELTLNAFKSGMFLLKPLQGKELKILTHKQYLNTFFHIFFVSSKRNY